MIPATHALPHTIQYRCRQEVYVSETQSYAYWRNPADGHACAVLHYVAARRQWLAYVTKRNTARWFNYEEEAIKWIEKQRQ